MLLDGDGNTIFSEVGELDLGRLSAALERLPAVSARNVLAKGRIHGFSDDRPEGARGFDEAAFYVEFDHFISRNADSMPFDASKEVVRLFEFYHRALPSDTWGGDSDCREAFVQSILQLRDTLVQRSQKAAVDQLKTELVNLISGSDPNWVVRASLATIAGKALGKSQESINLLSVQLERETNPVVRFHLTRSLEWLDDSRIEVIPPASPYKEAMNAFISAKQGWSSRVFGLSDDLKQYEDYTLELQSRLDSGSRPELITRLAVDYQEHRSIGRRDILIRHFIIETAGALALSDPLPPADRCKLEEWIFMVFKSNEPDWAIRQRAWFALDSALQDIHCLEKRAILGALEDRLRKESVREVRAYLELGRMQILGLEH